jgi:ATP adenylyltransferase
MSERPPLWAPWRMEYILGAKPSACIFCEYAARGAVREDLVLVHQRDALVMLNRYPFASGHVLVLPTRHVSALEELTDEEYGALCALLRASIAALKRAITPEGFNVGFNLGKVAGAGIAEHLHAHVVPRWAGDTNFMPVVADTRVMPEHLDATWVKLRAAFDAIPGAKAAMP